MADLLPLQTGMLAVHIPTPEPAKDSDDDVRDAAAAPVMPPTTRLRLNLNKSAPPTVAAAGQSFARAPPAVSPPSLDRPAGPPRRLALRMMTRTSSQQVHCNDAPTMEPPVKVKGVEVDGGAVAAPSSNPLQHSSSVFHGSPARGPTPFDSTSVTYGVTQTATAPSSTVRPSTDAFPSSPNRTPEPYGVGRAPSAAVLVNRIPSKVPLDPIAPLHVAGTVWDKYKLERKIGEGTYGEVYYCTTKERINNVHVPVAVKKFKVLDHIEGIPTTTIREITILRSLTQRPSPCPNVTSLRDVVVSPDFTELYLVFDFAEHSLYGLLASRVVLDEGHYKCIARQVLQGLVALHQEHIVHRDLKLNNILVDAHGCVKLCDFGLAFSTTSQRARVTPSLVSLPYRPPEMLFNRAAYNEAVDVWAFGCLLAQLFLGGSPPFMLSGGRVPASSEVEQLGLIAQAFDCSPWDLLTRETLAQCQPLWASTGGVSPPPEGLRRPPQARCLTAHLNRLCAERNRRPVPPDVAEIICLALAPDPKDRPTAEQLMARPWFAVRSRDDDQERLSVAVRKGAGDRFCHSAPTRAEDA